MFAAGAAAEIMPSDQDRCASMRVEYIVRVFAQRGKGALAQTGAADCFQEAGRNDDIGIDVGGTKVAAALVTFPEATLRLSQVIPTNPKRGGAAVLDDILDALKKNSIAQREQEEVLFALYSMRREIVLV